MTSELVTAARKAKEWTERRDALICAARADGASLRAIAEQAGLTHTAIAKIVARAASTEALAVAAVDAYYANGRRVPDT